MSTISSLGVGSNLDLGGLLDKLASAERAPLAALQKQQTSYNAKLSAYGTVQGALAQFQAAAQKLADANLFQGFKPASSAADVVTATASGTAVPASYSVEVSRLATAQSLAATGVADPRAPIGLGTITFAFGRIGGGTLDATTGRYTGASFTPDAARPAQQLVLDASHDSLEGLRDSINRMSGLGVTASIVHDGSATPHRLVLTSSITGEASSLCIQVTGDAGLQGLMAHDPAGTQNLQQTRPAADAALTLNGVAVRCASNQLTDAVQGVSLSLARTGSSVVSIVRDPAAAEAAANAFVSAYNSLLGHATVLTRYDAKKQTGAALVGDSTLRTLQTRLRAALTSPQPGALQVLSRVGIGFEKDGTLSLNSVTFNKAMAEQPAAVAELFAGPASALPVAGGVGRQVASLITGFTASDGLLSAATAGVKTTLKVLEQRHATTESSIASKIERFRAQFTQLDLVMSRMTSTTTYLQQQFASMNGSSK